LPNDAALFNHGARRTRREEPGREAVHHEILNQVRAVGLVDQLVVVDDYSTDGKREVLEAESRAGRAPQANFRRISVQVTISMKGLLETYSEVDPSR